MRFERKAKLVLNVATRKLAMRRVMMGKATRLACPQIFAQKVAMHQRRTSTEICGASKAHYGLALMFGILV